MRRLIQPRPSQGRRLEPNGRLACGHSDAQTRTQRAPPTSGDSVPLALRQLATWPALQREPRLQVLLRQHQRAVRTRARRIRVHRLRAPVVHLSDHRIQHAFAGVTADTRVEPPLVTLAPSIRAGRGAACRSAQSSHRQSIRRLPYVHPLHPSVR